MVSRCIVLKSLSDPSVLQKWNNASASVPDLSALHKGPSYAVVSPRGLDYPPSPRSWKEQSFPRHLPHATEPLSIPVAAEPALARNPPERKEPRALWHSSLPRGHPREDRPKVSGLLSANLPEHAGRHLDKKAQAPTAATRSQSRRTD